MKKIIAVLLLGVILISSAAMAEVDLGAMTFAELIQLQTDIKAEMIKRPEFKSFTVPAGEWIIGEDIPAGAYKLELAMDSVVIHLWGAAVDDYNTNGGLLVSDFREIGYGKINLRSGNILVISKPIILSVYGGL